MVLETHDKRLRHCMVVHSYYPYDETRVQREAHALLEAGFQVDIICLRLRDEPVFERVDHGAIYRLPVRRDKRRGAAGQLVEYLHFASLAFLKLTSLHARERYHVVQVHNLPNFLVFSAVGPKLLGAKILLDVHDLAPEFLCEKLGASYDSMPARLMRAEERVSARFADRVITVTEPWRQALIGRSVRPERCAVVMNTAEQQFVRARVQHVDRERGTALKLIYHGTLARRYGIDLALRALAMLREDLPDISFRIHGRGEYQAEIAALIDELQLHDRVKLTTEFLSTPELARLAGSGDLGLVPYRQDVFVDGILPTKLMEYMALGVPVVAARTAGISAHCDDSMVEFFRPNDVDDLAQAIRRLYHDRERLEQLRANTAYFNARYNWRSESARYVQLVTELAGRAAGLPYDPRGPARRTTIPVPSEPRPHGSSATAPRVVAREVSP